MTEQVIRATDFDGPPCRECDGRGWVRTLPPLWLCALGGVVCGGLLWLIFTS